MPAHGRREVEGAQRRRRVAAAAEAGRGRRERLAVGGVCGWVWRATGSQESGAECGLVGGDAGEVGGAAERLEEEEVGADA